MASRLLKLCPRNLREVVEATFTERRVPVEYLSGRSDPPTSPSFLGHRTAHGISMQRRNLITTGNQYNWDWTKKLNSLQSVGLDIVVFSRHFTIWETMYSRAEAAPHLHARPSIVLPQPRRSLMLRPASSNESARRLACMCVYNKKE